MGPKPSKDKKGKQKIGLGLVKSLLHVWREKPCIEPVLGLSGVMPSPPLAVLTVNSPPLGSA